MEPAPAATKKEKGSKKGKREASADVPAPAPAPAAKEGKKKNKKSKEEKAAAAAAAAAAAEPARGREAPAPGVTSPSAGPTRRVAQGGQSLASIVRGSSRGPHGEATPATNSHPSRTIASVVRGGGGAGGGAASGAPVPNATPAATSTPAMRSPEGGPTTTRGASVPPAEPLPATSAAVSGGEGVAAATAAGGGATAGGQTVSAAAGPDAKAAEGGRRSSRPPRKTAAHRAAAVVENLQADEDGLVPGMTVDTPRTLMLPEVAGRAMHTLESSLEQVPEAKDSERPRAYVPRWPVPPHPVFPQQAPPTVETPATFHKLDTDALFFAFFFQQGTYAQYLATKELRQRSWRFHTQLKTWIQRFEQPVSRQGESEHGTFVYFDYISRWSRRIKRDFTFHYEFLEDDVQ